MKPVTLEGRFQFKDNLYTADADVIDMLTDGVTVYNCPNGCKAFAEMVGERFMCGDCGYWLVAMRNKA